VYFIAVVLDLEMRNEYVIHLLTLFVSCFQELKHIADLTACLLLPLSVTTAFDLF
jgi:hypothetical protein